jgi:hypothetical protein
VKLKRYEPETVAKRITEFTASTGAAKGKNASAAGQAARRLEARDGIEPSVKVLQTYALPLGYRALENRLTRK